MTYKIVDVEGIGEVYSAKLIEVGIKTVDQLLEQGCKPAGRKELEAATGISGKLILEWCNHADLMRIFGIGPEFSDLLEEAGVDTVKELRNRVPANLQPKLEEVNAEKKLVRRVPSLKEVEKMVARAKELEPKMEY